MIDQLIQAFLSNRSVAIGQTIQFGWLIFRIRDIGPPISFESFDFQKLASFTADLSEAEKIHHLQEKTLSAHATEGEPCSLLNTAIVSRSYSSEREDAFIKRDSTQDGHSSGWYVGVLNESLDLNDVNSFALQSLYELSISDNRMYPYWLMPVGTKVLLHQDMA